MGVTYEGCKKRIQCNRYHLGSYITYDVLLLFILHVKRATGELNLHSTRLSTRTEVQKRVQINRPLQVRDGVPVSLQDVNFRVLPETGVFGVTKILCYEVNWKGYATLVTGWPNYHMY